VAYNACLGAGSLLMLAACLRCAWALHAGRRAAAQFALTKGALLGGALVGALNCLDIAHSGSWSAAKVR
jgi:hypothetical protein